MNTKQQNTLDINLINRKIDSLKKLARIQKLTMMELDEQYNEAKIALLLDGDTTMESMVKELHSKYTDAERKYNVTKAKLKDMKDTKAKLREDQLFRYLIRNKVTRRMLKKVYDYMKDEE